MDSKHLGEALPRLVSRIVKSYQADERTQYIDREHLPSRHKTIKICNMLLELTYPGFIGRKGLTRYNISFHVGELLPRCWEELTEQILRCLCHEWECHRGPDEEHEPPCRAQAVELASRFSSVFPTSGLC